MKNVKDAFAKFAGRAVNIKMIDLKDHDGEKCGQAYTFDADEPAINEVLNTVSAEKVKLRIVFKPLGHTPSQQSQDPLPGHVTLTVQEHKGGLWTFSDNIRYDR